MGAGQRTRRPGPVPPQPQRVRPLGAAVRAAQVSLPLGHWGLMLWPRLKVQELAVVSPRQRPLLAAEKT